MLTAGAKCLNWGCVCMNVYAAEVVFLTWHMLGNLVAGECLLKGQITNPTAPLQPLS